MRSALLLLLTAACTEPVVDMQLVMPKDGAMNTSCITAVDVFANGGTYPANGNDYLESCIEITAGATYESVRDAIKGKFILGMPATGLSSLEIYGYSGPAGCTFNNTTPPPNLLFFGTGDYIGQDTVNLPITPNLDCGTTPVKIRMVDMMALSGGATCANATNVGTQASAGLVTLMPRTYGKGVEIDGGTDGAPTVNNVSAFSGHTHVGTHSCLGTTGGSEAGGSAGCVMSGPTVCAGAGEIEHAYIPNPIYAAALNVDQTQLAKFPSAILGTVFSNAKTPVTGATVDVDTNHAKVYYVDPPAAGQSGFHVRTMASTGASGLFLVYADTLVSATVKANGGSRTVTLGAANQDVAGAMIVMP